SAVCADGLTGDADHLARVVLVLGKGQHMNVYRRLLAFACDRVAELLVARAAEQSEVADAAGDDIYFLPAVRKLVLAGDRTGTAELLVGGQGHASMIDAGLVIERLMPGDEGRWMPAV